MSEASLPSGWSSIITSDGFEQISTTKKKVKTKECLATGLYPVIDQGQDKVAGYIDDHEKVIEITDPVLIFGDHTRAIKWIDKDFVPGADGTKVLKPKGFLRPRFSYYQMRALELPDKGYSRHFKFLKEIKFSIPPLNEQTRIANKLDELLAQVDTIKARVDAIPNILKRFRQSVLAAAVSGKLTEEWRGHSSYTETALGVEIPNSWELKQIEDFAEVKGGKRLPKGEELVDQNTGLPYIRAGQLKLGTVINGDSARNCQKFLLPHVQAQIKRYIVNEGDVYITIVGASIGDAGTIPSALDKANLTENAAKICEFSKSVKGGFIALWLRSSFIQQFIQHEIKSGAQGKLALKRIKSLPLPEVELEEQKQIVQRVDQLFAFADQIEQRVKEAQTRIDKLSQSILAKAFRGELVPQDPNDEPASVLLERIKQEREEAAKLAKAAKKVGKKVSKK